MSSALLLLRVDLWNQVSISPPNRSKSKFYPVETMDTEGFEKANYFGYEDDVMLEPSKKWLEKNRDKPFVAAYETITPHHDYQAPKRYGIKDFAENEELNRY